MQYYHNSTKVKARKATKDKKKRPDSPFGVLKGQDMKISLTSPHTMGTVSFKT